MEKPQCAIGATSGMKDDTEIPEFTELNIASESPRPTYGTAENDVTNIDANTGAAMVDSSADVTTVDCSAGVTMVASPAGIIKEDIKLPKSSSKKLAFVLYNVFTEKECKAYIKKTEKMGYTEALVNVGGGRQQLMLDVRNNTRCIWDSFEEANRLWERIKTYVPDSWKRRQVLALNERLRFLRYDPGQHFLPHMDGMYMRDNGEQSHMTVMLYLNQGFEGGSTTFLDAWDEDGDKVELVPKTGSVLVFQHDILHEGSTLKHGRKYCMRTDVMFAGIVH